MNRVLLIIVALLCIPAFTESIQACECREYQTPLCALYWRSDAVFVGQVVDIKPLKIKPDNVYTYVMVSFTVEESFRGVTGPRIGVGVAVNTLCEPKFKKGKRYLVYASLNADTNQLFTGACRGTTLVDDDDEEYLDELRKLRQREVGESIAGRIVTNRYSGLAGIKVEVTNNEQTFTTLTSKDGDFSLSLPSGGSFKVRVLVPYSARRVDHSDDDVAVRSNQTDSLSTFEYDVKLEKSQCSYLVLDVFGVDPRATATVAGKVVDATGQAVDRGVVYLMNGVDTEPDYRALLEKDGSFRFRRVSAGEYHLVLNATHEVPQAFDAPYARTYYPGTRIRARQNRFTSPKEP